MLVQDGFALCVVYCHLPGQGVKVGVTRRMDPMEVLGNLCECSIVFSDIQHGTTLQYRKRDTQNLWLYANNNNKYYLD